MKFFNPTVEYKELLLLEHIEKKPDTSQHEIARKILSAVSMVNVYIERLEKKGYLIRNYQSAKIVYYHITPEGIKRKNYLLITYLKELMDLYKLAKSYVEDFLKDIVSKGFKNILLYGAGEVADTIIGVIRDNETKNINVLAIIDDNIVKQSAEYFGFKVIDRLQINNIKHDAIVITSYRFEEKILVRLKEIEYDPSRIIRFFGTN